jgi:acetyl/propionyl-CoA carboxylase alpha subunit/acetyl-CoA carboxylase carboxyltransferase component
MVDMEEPEPLTVALTGRGVGTTRILRALRELERTSRRRFRTLAVVEADAESTVVERSADEVLRLPRGMRISDVDRVAEVMGAHPIDLLVAGASPGEPVARWAETARDRGWRWVGPSAACLRRLLDPLELRRRAEARGIRTVPWSGQVLHTLDEAGAHAERVGYPVLLRSPSAVQTGLGVAYRPEDLPEVFAHASELSARASGAEPRPGAGGVILEKLLRGMRRLEVPVVSFPSGERWVLDAIDASLRRRDSSVLVEAPAQGLGDDARRRLEETARDLADAFDHEHVGTMAFLLDPEDESVVFLGYDFGRGGEHAAAEMLRGIDLAKLRVQFALGDDPTAGDSSIDGELPPTRGHALSAHLRIEPHASDQPVLEHLRPASGPGVRTDVAASAGDHLHPGSSVAELVAWGRHRTEALARLEQALGESSYIVQGGETSLSLLLALLGAPELRSGPVRVDWLVEKLREGGFRSRRHAAEAVLVAAVEAYELGHAADREAFGAAAARGRPETRPPGPRAIELELEGHVYPMEVAAVGRHTFDVACNGELVRLELGPRRGQERVLSIGPDRFTVTSSIRGPVHEVLVDGEPHRVLRETGGVIRARFPALVADLHVQEGDVVTPGQRVATLEAMKMELEVSSDFAGRVRKVLVQRSQQVSPSQPLVWLASEPEPEPEARPSASSGPPADLAGVAGRARSSDPLELLTGFVRGYDVSLARAREAAKSLGPSDLAREAEIIRGFVHLLELSPASPQIEDAADGGLRLSYGEYLRSYLLSWDTSGLPRRFLDRLLEAVGAYGVDALRRGDPLMEAIYRLHMAMARRSEIVVAMLDVLGRQAELGAGEEDTLEIVYRPLLDRLIALTQSALPEVCETARAARFRLFDGPHLQALRAARLDELKAVTAELERGPSAEAIEHLVETPLPVSNHILRPSATDAPGVRRAHLVAMTRRYNRSLDLAAGAVSALEEDVPIVRASIRERGDQDRTLVAWIGALSELPEAARALHRAFAGVEGPIGVDLLTWREGQEHPSSSALRDLLERLALPRTVDRVTFVIGPGDALEAPPSVSPCETFLRTAEGALEHAPYQGLHPQVAERLELHRLGHFELERQDAPADVYAFLATGKDQPEDRRIFIHAEVRDLTPVRDEAGQVVAFPQLERTFAEALSCLRRLRREQDRKARTESNRLELFLRPPVGDARQDLTRLVRKLAPATVGLGLEEVRINGRFDGDERQVLRLSNPSGLGVELRLEPPSQAPIPLLSRYEQKVAKLRRRGLTHPHELARLLTPDALSETPELPRGTFEELDLDEDGQLAPVDRGPGENVSNIIVARMTTFTDAYPEGMTRIALFGDPSRAMGSLAEPECRRIMVALDLAEAEGLPAEWYAISAGAEISKDRGTENMDWISAVLRRIIEFTQAGHELNIVVCGINVGAQPYWNAEATMLMHTKGILVMVPGTAMVLTGKQALDFSGGVSAEDNLGIGGYDRVMGPNGQAQYFAPDLVSAGKLLLRHYAHTYRAPGERYPRRRATTDAFERDVCEAPHGPAEGSSFERVGDIFSNVTNPGRKRPFDIRSVMRALADQDHPHLERWRDMRDAETVVTWDAHLGGFPVALLGIESRPIRRLGYVPGDGPRMWTSGTFVPQSSKKMARSINAASGNRPLVILANLSGFDGSPESLRKLQLEFGAEIGRAIVNFEGPIAFAVVSRFHGGAFVVFSQRLNERMEIFALEGTYASVIGGAPAAAVVFARELRSRVRDDPRVTEAEAALQAAEGADKAQASVRLREARGTAYADHLGALAREYDGIHSVERAQRVGSVHHIIPPARLRPELIAAVERGVAKDVP